MSVGVHHILSDVEPRVEPLVTDFKKSSISGETNGSGAASDLFSPLSPMTATTMTNEYSDDARDSASSDIEEKITNFCLSSSSIDEDRPMKVVVIGAGFSGIIAGIRFPQRIKNLDLTIYEKNAGIGGTWFSNRYPGLACDIPSHCYQLTFEVNTDWSSFYAPGPEIRAYLERVVEKYKLMRYIKLRHELVHARYNEADGKWHLKIRRPVPGTESGSEADIRYEIIEDTADFVHAGIGTLSRWSWPKIDGLGDFRGTLVHSASWEFLNESEQGLKEWEESVKDWGDKRVGVIGVGSSALQIVPALRPHVKHIYNYVRGKTWLSPPFVSGKIDELQKGGPASSNYKFTEDDKERFKDVEYYKTFRRELEVELNSVHMCTIRGTEMQQGAREAFRQNMLKKLEPKPWIADHLIPDFPVACRRLTPGPGYLEALCEDDVDFIPTHIKRITDTGIELVDGTHHELDVIVCATGYDVSFQYPFSIIGRNGQTLNSRFLPHPETYLTLCTNGFPNWFMSLGPNSGIGSGSLLVIMERQIDYAIAAVRKLQREHLKSIEPKVEAVKDFDEYLEHFFRTTVFSEKCRSWYKMGKEEGRVVGLWPGSCLHAVKAIEAPRWEDFNYETLDSVPGRNRFFWLGDGSTYNEKYMTGNRAWYLDDDQIDYPPVPIH